MNPVRTLGPAIAANNYKAIWVYLTAPIVGTLCGAGTYSLVKLPEETDAQDKPPAVQSLRHRKKKLHKITLTRPTLWSFLPNSCTQSPCQDCQLTCDILDTLHTAHKPSHAHTPTD